MPTGKRSQRTSAEKIKLLCDLHEFVQVFQCTCIFLLRTRPSAQLLQMTCQSYVRQGLMLGIFVPINTFVSEALRLHRKRVDDGVCVNLSAAG